MKHVKEADIQPNTKVFVRCDLDVPMLADEIVETYRLEACLETLKYIIEKGGVPIIAGHMGRPKGKVVNKLSTTILQPYFQEKLGMGKFKLLENLRFNPGERANDETYAKELASEAEIYVNESFGVCHRPHASIIGIPKLLPSYAGFRLKREIETLNKLIQNPERPFIAVIGGAKMESKKPAILKFSQIADRVLVGGKIGLDWEGSAPNNVMLPIDYAVQNLDIGRETIQKYKSILKDAKTIVWSGPMGKYENDNYIRGTREIATSIRASPAFSIIGGGDVTSALGKLNLRDDIDFISVGGGAMLEFFVKGTLPGLEVLDGQNP